MVRSWQRYVLRMLVLDLAGWAHNPAGLGIDMADPTMKVFWRVCLVVTAVGLWTMLDDRGLDYRPRSQEKR